MCYSILWNKDSYLLWLLSLPANCILNYIDLYVAMENSRGCLKWMLCTLTSKMLLCMPLAGQVIFFGILMSFSVTSEKKKNNSRKRGKIHEKGGLLASFFFFMLALSMWDIFWPLSMVYILSSIHTVLFYLITISILLVGLLFLMYF